MEIKISDNITLSTDHAGSSYDQPVAIIDGQVYGPKDQVIGMFDVQFDAAEGVANQATASGNDTHISPCDRNLLAQFCGPDPFAEEIKSILAILEGNLESLTSGEELASALEYINGINVYINECKS